MCGVWGTRTQLKNRVVRVNTAGILYMLYFLYCVQNNRKRNVSVVNQIYIYTISGFSASNKLPIFFLASNEYRGLVHACCGFSKRAVSLFILLLEINQTFLENALCLHCTLRNRDFWCIAKYMLALLSLPCSSNQFCHWDPEVRNVSLWGFLFL